MSAMTAATVLVIILLLTLSFLSLPTEATNIRRQNKNDGEETSASTRRLNESLEKGQKTKHTQVGACR